MQKGGGTEAEDMIVPSIMLDDQCTALKLIYFIVLNVVVLFFQHGTTSGTISHQRPITPF